MKWLKPLLLFSGLLTLTLSGYGQDMHNTLFNYAPLSLNPSLTGAFEGTARIGGIYRAQDFAVAGAKGYSTPSFYLDAPIIRGFGKRDWIGVGLVFFSDKAGSLSLQTNAGWMSGAYHLSLDKKGNTYLTFGVQGGKVGRRFKSFDADPADQFDLSVGGQGNVTTEDQVIAGNGGGSGTGGNTDFDRNKNFTDFTGGLMLRSKINNDAALELGLAVGHVTTPQYGFSGVGDGSKRPRKITFHGRYDQKLDDKWSIAPTLLFMSTSKAQEISLQGWLGRQVNPDVKLNFGLGYRLSDAGKVLFGIDYKDLHAAMAYDLTLSSKSDVNNFNGAFELAAYYILKIYKKPEVKPAIFCPRF